MSLLVHISDIHFGRETTEVMEGLLTSLAQINPELVIISGDITQRATDEEFAGAQAFLKRLTWPYFIIPGNHDMPTTRVVERFFNPWEKWALYISPTTEPTLSTPDYMLVGVNTVRAAGWYFDWSRGQISLEQIQEVQNTMQQSHAGALRMVVAHHPFWLPDIAEYRDVVEQRDEAIAGFQAAGVDMILSGHVHMAYTRILSGVLIVHCGTTFSNRTLDHNPNSFNVINGDRQALTVTVMQWQDAHFQLARTEAFKRSDTGWQAV